MNFQNISILLKLSLGLNSIIITLGQKIIFMLIKQSINLQKIVPGTNYHLLLTGQIKTF